MMIPQMPQPPAQYVVDSFGNAVPTGYYNNQQQYYNYNQPQYSQQQYYQQQPVQELVINTSTGIPFGKLPIVQTKPIVVEDVINTSLPEKSTSKRKKKKESTEVTTTDGKTSDNPSIEVETIQYSDTYQDTTYMLRQTIAQLDQVASEVKMEMDKIRGSSMKGKYMYYSNLSGSLSGMLSTKINAIREMNNSIKAINEAEYRRYKDYKQANTMDDDKAIMDMYNAYIHTPLGALPNNMVYQVPTTFDLTANMAGAPASSDPGFGPIIRADTASPQEREAGFNSYMSNLTPEQNMMINEGNPNIQEVLIRDYTKGGMDMYFDWIDRSTGQRVPNMPIRNKMFVEEFTINPNTMMAKSTNLRVTMPVVDIGKDSTLEKY